MQQEDGDADLALVLQPQYWGLGKVIFDEIIRHAFQEMGLKSITILLPPARTPIRGVLRLEFRPDGGVDVDGTYFTRYRLLASTSAKVS